jgi:two-component sensor histidine kinase
LVWQERDGPSVSVNRKRGFGTSFVERVLSSINGSIHTDWRKAGVVHEVRFRMFPNSTA